MRKLPLLLLAIIAPITGFAQLDYTGWHFPLSLTYSTGFKDVIDASIGGVPNTTYINLPMSVAFSPHRAFANGVSVGADIGPCLWFFVDRKSSGLSGTGAKGVVMPLGAYVRYNFVRDGAWLPYVRGGVRHCFVANLLFDHGGTGVYGNLGLMNNRGRDVGWGCEMGADTTEIEVYRLNSGGNTTTATRKAKPCKFTISAFMSF